MLIPFLNLINFVPIHIVAKLVIEIDIYKSSSIENLSSELMRDAFQELHVELTHLINESLSQAIIPASWAVGYVTPTPEDAWRSA